MIQNFTPLAVLMKITKRMLVTACLLLVYGLAHAQDKPILKKRTKPEDVWKKTFVAINLTPSLGGNSFGAYISPTFGYRVTENFNAAAGPLYMFNSFSNGTGGRTTASIWGGRLWAQHRIFRTFYGHAEYEVMNAIKMRVDANGTRYYYTNANGDFPRQAIGNPLVGFAFVSAGEKGEQSITILYNLNYVDSATPYQQFFNIPIVFRASLSFNLGGN